jgi:hypothetical protein
MDNGDAPIQELEVELEPMPEGPMIRGMATIKVLSDGNYQVELAGVTQLEAPALFRICAKRVEHELGIG